MKLLFFSDDLTEVELASKALLEAGVPCQIRNEPENRFRPRKSRDTELWIRNPSDTSKAMLLCVQLGVGFGKRPAGRTDSE